ncbi:MULTISPECIES: peptidoglycan editing factor PgeF [Acidobacteriaceae]|uniref:peptidoglycan editing factor PgeF n=1 Tax=Acidobacteriaceae TaxID=204434 RepID=UPI00131E0F2E|nr:MULTISPECIES: peptidoglycan editing factor PgeF [Acidobacteriaceae]MDW5265004.1 peptidoglycan editing factor PgeF [Edaphobacter sp.]
MNIVNKGLTVGIVRVEPWGSYKWLRHGFSTRQGGVSTVYGGNSLNLGWTKDDGPALVAENRRLFYRLSQGSLPENHRFQTVTLKQVHSALVLPIRKEEDVFEGTLQTADGKAVLEGDGAVTDLPGVMLGVQTADCVPVLIADVNKRVVAAIHAGWRGTAARIVEQGCLAMQERYGSRPEELVAAVGPSIGACCYAVGEEVRSGFGAQFEYADALFRTGETGQMHLDLWEANRRQLLDAGVPAQSITVIGECTACTVSGGEKKYFSHRAEHGFTGRMMSVIGVV